MTTDEKMTFFMELLNCSHQLYYWKYDADMTLIETTYTDELFSDTFFDYVGFRQLIQQHLENQRHTPLLLEAETGLLWITGFQVHNSVLEQICLIGPVLSGKNSHLILKKKLDAYDLSVKLRASISKMFDGIPPIPSNTLFHYAIMLHYCLNGEKINSTDISYQNLNPSGQSDKISLNSSSHPGIWFNEKQFCKMIADGNPQYVEVLQKMQLLSHGMKFDMDDALRYHKNNSIVLLTLCSRACIEGGLSPDISFDLNDYYGQKIELCRTINDLSKLGSEMLEDYVSRVQEVKKNSSVSNAIRNSCEYIRCHLGEDLSIESLAARTGYTGYYFSHKFKKETGCTVNEFILNEKIEQAKLLLCGTSESIQSISDQLAFGNRSYFYTCFQKKTGMSPSQYRTSHQGCS